MDKNSDRIELLLPFKAEYVSIARLLASGVASKTGFDIETIEDIKVAVSEVCNQLIKIGSRTSENFKIVFNVVGNRLGIDFDCEDEALKCVFGDEDNELGIFIINALMDEVELCTNSKHILSMSKTVEGNT